MPPDADYDGDRHSNQSDRRHHQNRKKNFDDHKVLVYQSRAKRVDLSRTRHLCGIDPMRIDSIVVPNFINGFAGGFIFVPMTTLSMGMLKKQEIGNAAGIYNLIRNIGGSIGIATITALLVRGAQNHQNFLAANLTATNPGAAGLLQALQAKFMEQGASAATAHQEALGALYRTLEQQASLLAYADNFQLLGYLSLFCIPPILLLHRLHKNPHRDQQVKEK